MNKPRRKELNAIIEQLENLKEELDRIKYEEEEYYDNMPEPIQCGTKGEASEAAIDNMNDAYDAIENAIDSITEAIE